VKPIILMLVILSSTARGACLPATGSRILGRDLAAAEPGLAALPQTVTFGFAPAPGAKRIFSAAELARIARANAIPFQPVEAICFEVPLRVVSTDDAMAAMRRALPPGTEIKLIEIQQNPVPIGTIEFTRSGLEPMAPAGIATAEIGGPARNGRAQLWRGFVRFGETQKWPFWARVLISAPPAPAGAQVQSAEEIHRGDTIHVEVECGRAHLAIDAVAVAAARAGDLVDLRNPATGKTFKARLITASRARLIL
jgi:hypothetical protein